MWALNAYYLGLGPNIGVMIMGSISMSGGMLRGLDGLSLAAPFVDPVTLRPGDSQY